MNHTLSVLVANKPGVLTRITGLFARRGFNIHSLAVGVTDDPTMSRITLIVEADRHSIEQITKQLHKLIDVYKITDLTELENVSRELVLFKVNAPADKRHEIVEIASLFRANVVDVGKHSVIIAVTGDNSKINAIEDLLRAYGIKETVRTGAIALARGSKV